MKGQTQGTQGPPGPLSLAELWVWEKPALVDLVEDTQNLQGRGQRSHQEEMAFNQEDTEAPCTSWEGRDA